MNSKVFTVLSVSDDFINNYHGYVFYCYIFISSFTKEYGDNFVLHIYFLILIEKVTFETHFKTAGYNAFRIQTWKQYGYNILAILL